MTVTQINAGKQHNVVPSECDIVVDIQTTATPITNFSHRKEHVNAEVTPRSMNLSSSSIPENHG
jgi:acetylornithine deacetylase